MGTVIELHKDMYTRRHVVQRTRIVEDSDVYLGSRFNAVQYWACLKISYRK
jgi:hypothetical protein